MYIKHIYFLTNKEFLPTILQSVVEYKVIHVNYLNECRTKIDILIIDHIDKESFILKNPHLESTEYKKHYIKYIIHIGEKYRYKKLYSNLYIQKEIFISRPFRLLQLRNTIYSVLNDHLPFLMIDNEFIFDYQNARFFSIYKPANKINLTEKEMQILQHMLLSEQYSSSRYNMGKLIWNFNDNIQSSTIETHIYKLKQKLKAIIMITKNEYYLNVKEIY